MNHIFQMGGWNHQPGRICGHQNWRCSVFFFVKDEVAEGDRREDVLQCRALGERALRPDGRRLGGVTTRNPEKSDETYERIIGL